MTFSEAVFTEAAKTFGKRAGHAETLTPYSRTWRTVIERAEHALWLWNDKYGPLSPKQRQYASELVCSALTYAREKAPNVGQTYAFFHTQLTHLLNHERVHQGFQQRAELVAADESLLDSLPVFLEVAC